jgi:hypothetical protein
MSLKRALLSFLRAYKIPTLLFENLSLISDKNYYMQMRINSVDWIAVDKLNLLEPIEIIAKFFKPMHLST